MSTTIQPPKKTVNYLNNRDILKEIHASKNSYCSFAKPEYHQYDYIINMPTEPLHKSFEWAYRPDVLAAAREARAARLGVDPESIPVTDLVFRVMTWDHVPLAPKVGRKVQKRRTARDIMEFEDDDGSDDLDDVIDDAVAEEEVDDMIHTKVNFPPFQHYKINANNSFYCVGKSHWRGDLQTGEFCKDHGQITKTLAKMYLMMTEKYAMKFNWRGYTYNDEMRASAVLQLTYVGLRFNEAKSSNPFAYYTAATTNSFRRVLNNEKKNQNLRDDILELNGLNPSWTRMNSSSTTYSED